MWQRTQILINIKDDKWKTKSMAYHNQRGFGRPTVTWTLSAVLFIKDFLEEDSAYVCGRYITHKNIRHALCLPIDWYEFFDRSEPYKCSAKFDYDEHDNNDWYSIINVDFKEKTIDYAFYTYEWVKLTDEEYIEYTDTKNYCPPEWWRRRWEMLKKITA